MIIAQIIYQDDPYRIQIEGPEDYDDRHVRQIAKALSGGRTFAIYYQIPFQDKDRKESATKISADD